MSVLNIKNLIEFSGREQVKKVLFDLPKTKGLLICFEPGQSVPPCIMASDLIFYTVEGKGLLEMEGEKQDMQEGILIMVPANKERKITAITRLVVLAIQIH
ncbi:cupin domain-containing protein [Desulfoscipio geothermicus]|uniref:Cupin domain protein n=1 Tax=Desulfoscipio geothermicus DSM 3669 TaxID=1121426 RepID=A0A1I6D1U9_9FIRM|nr:cupin domain-containing protein [Desulfoscipio geothermicus]SFQ99478.1 Cupin domain protein [Desulfoscipio geothermicus DSM 3669]